MGNVGRRVLVAKKKNTVGIADIRKKILQTRNELSDIEKDLAHVQAVLEKFLNHSRIRGEDEYFADLRALTRKRR